MNFDKRFFKKNKSFIISLLVIIVIFAIIGFLSINPKPNKLIEKDLVDGKEKYNKLVINEVMTSNKGSYLGENKSVCDWVELYNGHDYDINLNGYGLSDRDAKTKWLFPNEVIESKSYIVVNLCGTIEEGLVANFKLSSSGDEKLYLINNRGKAIDAVDLSYLDENEVVARDLDGKFFTSKQITPGYSNTKDGYQNYFNSLKYESGIKINEALPDNNGNFKDENGYYSGYIEIINITDETQSLDGYYISNDPLVPYKYKIEGKKLKPNEVIAIYTNKIKSDSELYSGFKLSNKNGNVILTNSEGKIIDNLEYKNLANGLALIRDNNKYYESGNISKGYLNDSNGIESFNKKLTNPSDLIINEVVVSNYSFLPTNGNNYYDLIELKNNSKGAIDLSKYSLSDDINDIDKFNLPKVNLNPGEFIILMASGETKLTNSSYYHTNFKLSSNEGLFLSKSNEIVDSIFIGEVKTGYSYGKGKEYGYYYFDVPSPLAENNIGINSISYLPEFDLESGIYNDVDLLTLNINGSGTIYYTLDGSVPTTYSSVYNSPILIDKTTVVKAINVNDGMLSSDVLFSTYVVNEKDNLPVISISLPSYSFNKLVSNSWNTNLEEAATIEYYEGNENFKIPCGLQLFGGTTRGLSKKSFAVKFKKEYGVSHLNYKVFENRDYSSFDTLILRSGSQDYQNAYIRDYLITSLADGKINVNVQANKPVALYINGNYWGVYNLIEKVDEDYISSYYNVDGSSTNIIRIDNNKTVGDNKKYFDLLNFATSHDIRDNNNYNYINELLNIDSYIDFWVAESFVTNNDIINTRFFYNDNVDNGKINMIFYDLDYAMWYYDTNYFQFITGASMSELNVSTSLMRSLIVNDEFKKRFVERLSYQLKNVWTEERIIKRIDELQNLLKEDMKKDHNRWKLSYDEWLSQMDHLRNFARNRKNVIINQAKQFFNLNSDQVKEYFGE